MADSQLPRFMSDSNLDVVVDNRVNQRLFMGRIVHFSNEYYRAHRNKISSQFDLGVSLAAIVSLAANEGKFDIEFARCAAQVAPAWHEMDALISGQLGDADWKREAAEALEAFLIVIATGESFCSDSEVLRLAQSDHIAYLEWVDSSGVGGPSAELMCFMNPYWRSSGFIYGSPFDGQLDPDGPRLRHRYSEVARLRDRGLFPPRSANIHNV